MHTRMIIQFYYYCSIYGSSFCYAGAAFCIIMDVMFPVTHLLLYGATSPCLALWISSYVGPLVILHDYEQYYHVCIYLERYYGDLLLPHVIMIASGPGVIMH